MNFSQRIIIGASITVILAAVTAALTAQEIKNRIRSVSHYYASRHR